MCTPQSRAAALSHTEVREVSFLFQFRERLQSILEGHVARNPGHREEVHFLDTAELLVDGGYAAPQVLRPVVSSSADRKVTAF